MSLTDAKARAAKPREKPYRLTDGQGLCLEIKPSGSKFWRYRYMIDGRSTMLTLGDYPALSLADARVKHQEARLIVRAGESPVDVRRAEKAAEHAKNHNTFESIYHEWLRERMQGRTERYLGQIQDGMRLDILPAIGHKSIHEIKPADVLAVINSTMQRIRASGRRAGATGESAAINNRQWIGAVCQYAVQTLRAEIDPTHAVRRVVSKPTIENARALSTAEIKALLAALDQYNGTASTKGCIALLLLTMTRSTEARHARWQDIDLDNELWTIPAELMKKRRPHLVPLSRQAVQLLREHQKWSGANVWCFPSPKYPVHALGNTTINRALEYMRCDNTTGHDFRSTASTILNSNGFNGDWIEKQLAHVDGNATRRTYNHADHLPDRAKMLQWWADYLEGLK